MNRNSSHRSLPSSIQTSVFWIIGSILLLHASCKNDLKKIHQTIDRSMLNTERADSVTIIYSKEGITKAQLFAKTFNHVQDAKPPYIEMKNGIKVLFYNDSMNLQSTLLAKYGRYFEQSGNVLVRDSVVVYNIKKEQLNTEELIWNEKLQKDLIVSCEGKELFCKELCGDNSQCIIPEGPCRDCIS